MGSVMRSGLFLAATIIASFLQCCNNVTNNKFHPQDDDQLNLSGNISGISISDSDNYNIEKKFYSDRPDIPDEIKDNITSIRVSYLGFDSCIHIGNLDISIELAAEAGKIFDELLDLGFPIEKIRTMDNYGWSDSLSMADNNTSCFNYRKVKGQVYLSQHAYGKAIDINPVQNPYLKRRGTEPLNVVYDTSAKGTITAVSDVVKSFKKYGWSWGGNWKYSKDYQHFYKN